VTSNALVVAARFDPPDAHRQYKKWRTFNEPILSSLPADEMRIDIGRTQWGDFVRVWLLPEAAARCQFHGHA